MMSIFIPCAMEKMRVTEHTCTLPVAEATVPRPPPLLHPVPASAQPLTSQDGMARRGRSPLQIQGESNSANGSGESEAPATKRPEGHGSLDLAGPEVEPALVFSCCSEVACEREPEHDPLTGPFITVSLTCFIQDWIERLGRATEALLEGLCERSILLNF